MSDSFFYLGFWLLSVCKIAVKREQSQACLGYAEREQFGRSQNAKLNSRGFSNPWNTSRFNYRTVWKTEIFNTDGLLSPRTRCRSASLQTPFRSSLYPHGLKSPRLFAFGIPSFRRFCSLLIAHNSQLIAHCYIRPSPGRGRGRVLSHANSQQPMVKRYLLKYSAAWEAL